MKPLEAIIQSLSKYEARDFIYFIHSYKKEVKNIELFNLLRKGEHEKAKQLCNNLNAYHSLRKRLQKQLEDFIHILSNKEGVQEIMKLIATARYFFKHKLADYGIAYLIKAEQKASEEGNVQLLDLIYHEQLVNSNKRDARFLNEFIRKRIKNQSLLIDFINSENTYFNTVSNYLKELGGKKKKEREKSIKEIIRQHKLKRASTNNPEIRINLLSFVIRTLIEEKAFKELASILLDEVSFFESFHPQTPKIQYFIFQLFQALSFTLIKIRKYEQAEFYFHRFETIIKTMPLLYQQKFPFLSMIIIDIYSFTGRLSMAIEFSNFLSKQFSLSEIDTVFLFANRIGLYYQAKEYKKCKQMLQSLKHHRQMYLRELGIEKSLLLSITECIVYFASKDAELFTSRVRAADREINRLKIKKSDNIEKYIKFVCFIKKIHHHPRIVEQEEFQQEVMKFIQRYPLEPGDVEIISFNAWLLAKLKHQDYYETYLKLSK